MIKIRMQRIGRHKEPHYKIVAIESTRGPKSAQYIEELGSYNPKAGTTLLKADRITYWISVGAQPSDTVHNFLVSNKIVDDTKRTVKMAPKKKGKK